MDSLLGFEIRLKKVADGELRQVEKYAKIDIGKMQRPLAELDWSWHIGVKILLEGVRGTQVRHAITIVAQSN